MTPDEQAFAEGMIARCNEGGYSDHENFSATCSSAGDVAEWLGEFGECGDGRIIALNERASCDDNGGFERVFPAGFAPTARPTDIALCRDGTFSDNAEFSGTCSSAGEVAEWLADHVECATGEVVELDEDADCDGSINRLVHDHTPPTTSTTTTTSSTTTTSTTTTSTTTTTTVAPPSIVPLVDPVIASTAPPTTAAPTTAPPTTPPPPTVPPTTVAPVPPPPPPAPSNVSYQNCDAVRAAGAAPIYRGEPGYSRKLDRDGDGIGCE